jgi:hypothetical protein
MRIRTLSATLLLLASVAGPRARAAEPTPVIVELFTSEGCSSCPPADQLLSDLVRTQPVKDALVIPLSEHVDYWDHLGWKDVFSNPECSKRQRQYSAWLGTEQVYTPQVVINGKAECVGSNESDLNEKIQHALSTPITHAIVLQARQQEKKALINYQVKGQTAGNRLVIAVVQKHAVRKIQRGENEGRTLEHTSIVRDFRSFKIDQQKGSLELPLPEGFNLQDWEIMGLMQRTSNGEIVAAARAAFQ